MLDTPTRPDLSPVQALAKTESWQHYEIITHTGDGNLVGWDAIHQQSFPMCCKLKDIEAARTVSPEEYARLKRPYPWPWVVNP